MTLAEMKELVLRIQTNEENNYNTIGIRFENKSREIGEECEWSKNNADREDERDFPEYGTAEYDEMGVMDGTSAWYISEVIATVSKQKDQMQDAQRFYCADDHCYIIAGYHGNQDGCDEGEVVIQEAKVIATIF
jgi:hypothetical protein